MNLMETDFLLNDDDTSGRRIIIGLLKHGIANSSYVCCGFFLTTYNI